MGLCPMTPEEFAAYRADYQWLKQAPRTEETERDLDVFQAQFAFCDIEDAINQAQGLLRTMLGSDGQVWPRSAATTALLKAAITTLTQARDALIDDYVFDVDAEA